MPTNKERGLGEAHQIRVFIAQTQSPGFKSQNPHKEPDMVIHADNQHWGLGKWNEEDRWDLLTAILALSSERDPISREQNRVIEQDSPTSPCRMHTCMHRHHKHTKYEFPRKAKNAIRTTSHLCH